MPEKIVHQHLDLIAGLPFEDYESFGRSFNEVYSMEPEQFQLGFLKVLKGSYMHDMVEEYGLKYRERHRMRSCLQSGCRTVMYSA